MYKNFFRAMVLAFISAAFLAGCASQEVKKEEAPPAAPVVEEKLPVPEPPKAEEVKAAPVEPVKEEPLQEVASAKATETEVKKEEPVRIELKTVYFDFDKYAIRPGEREKLEENADILKHNPDAKVVIEGHCDERGETEYNLALGDKRAKSIEGYLKNLGVSGSRITTVSYGEERPAEKGHTESAWSKNRRAEFKVSQ